MTDRYERIRAALAMGPTPGEWYWSDAYPTQDGRQTWSLIGDGGFGILSCDGEENSPQSVNAAAAELIAACDPDTIRELLAERDQLAAALEAAREDAERWRFCVERDVMPVIANDGKTWCMFVAITSNRRSLFTGKTPAEAVDAAIDRERAKENGNG